MPHVFISYIRENKESVDKLVNELRSAGVETWIDIDKLKPGQRWKDIIKRAIKEGDFFIACFSSEYNDKSKTYMNEELLVEIDELRQRHIDRVWSIPVLFSPCSIPEINIGGGETLKSIQWLELFENWKAGVEQILSVIQPDLPDLPHSQITTPEVERIFEKKSSSITYSTVHDRLKLNWSSTEKGAIWLIDKLKECNFLPTLILASQKSGAIIGSILSSKLNCHLFVMNFLYDVSATGNRLRKSKEIPSDLNLDRVLLVTGQINSGYVLKVCLDAQLNRGANNIKTFAFLVSEHSNYMPDFFYHKIKYRSSWFNKWFK